MDYSIIVDLLKDKSLTPIEGLNLAQTEDIDYSLLSEAQKNAIQSLPKITVADWAIGNGSDSRFTIASDSENTYLCDSVIEGSYIEYRTLLNNY